MKNKINETHTLIIYNWDGVKCDTKFPVCDIKRIQVYRFSGDEVVRITDKKGMTYEYDSAYIAKDPRATSYYDGDFILDTEEDIQNWINDESRNIRVVPKKIKKKN